MQALNSFFEYFLQLLSLNFGMFHKEKFPILEVKMDMILQKEKENNPFKNSFDILKRLLEYTDVRNIRITVGCEPLRSALGVFFYTSSQDEQVMVEFNISEERYKVADNYKIGFLPTLHQERIYHHRDMYITDLESMIRSGHAKLRVIIEDTVA